MGRASKGDGPVCRRQGEHAATGGPHHPSRRAKTRAPQDDGTDSCAVAAAGACHERAGAGRLARGRGSSAMPCWPPSDSSRSIISLRLGVWRQNTPGEGLFPFLTSLAMLAFSAAGLARDWLKYKGAPSRDIRRSQRAQAGRGLSRRARVLCRVARIPGLHRRVRAHAHLHPAFRRALSLARDAGADRRHRDRLPNPVRALARRHPADRARCGPAFWSSSTGGGFSGANIRAASTSRQARASSKPR